VAVQDGRVVGYSAARHNNQRYALQEAAVDPTAPGAMDALLVMNVAKARELGAETVELWLPATEETVAAASRHLGAVRQQRATGGMVWFPDAEALLRGLAPILTERWYQAGRPDGRLAFRCPEGVVELASRGGSLHIGSGEDTGMGQALLFDLLTGGEHPALPPCDAEFACVLFPRYDRWYWEMDGF
jgi:hypothetical protein